jgi:chromosome segregation ATPase
MSTKPWSVKIIAAVASVVVCGLAVVAADQAGGTEPAGSLSTLTNEVKLLRQAVEKSTQTQSHVQAMAVYLSAQQNRLNQSAARADALRREFDEVSRNLREISRQLPDLERLVASGSLNTKPEQRAQTEDMVSALRSEVRALTPKEADLRARLAEADAAVQIDVARWNEMITRLEQLTRQ